MLWSREISVFIDINLLYCKIFAITGQKYNMKYHLSNELGTIIKCPKGAGSASVQNCTFEPVHEIWNFLLPKVIFWSVMKMPIRKNIHNMPQGLPNPGFMQEKVQKGDFLKKPSRELKFFCCFRFLWISQRPGTLNWKRLVFLLSKILYKKCVLVDFLFLTDVEFCLLWRTCLR